MMSVSEAEELFKEHSLYSVRKIDLNLFRVVCFDGMFNPIKTYHVRRGRERKLFCDCPASKNPICRHRRILLIFEQKMRVNKGWFLDYDKLLWEPPMTWPMAREYHRVMLKDY